VLPHFFRASKGGNGAAVVLGVVAAVAARGVAVAAVATI